MDGGFFHFSVILISSSFWTFRMVKCTFVCERVEFDQTLSRVLRIPQISPFLFYHGTDMPQPNRPTFTDEKSSFRFSPARFSVWWWLNFTSMECDEWRWLFYQVLSGLSQSGASVFPISLNFTAEVGEFPLTVINEFDQDWFGSFSFSLLDRL